MAVILKIWFLKLLYRMVSPHHHCEIALKWMKQNFVIERSKLVQVMAWCHQAPSQCWCRSTAPYGVTTIKWVNPCQVKFCLGHKIDMYFLSLNLFWETRKYICFFCHFLHEEAYAFSSWILPYGRLGPIYSTSSIQWLLMTWWYKELDSM